MAIYEFTEDQFRPIGEVSFQSLGVKERDVQKLLRNQIDIISPNTLIIDEEFCDWQDSSRRIDLLGIDKEANLVVVELKRDEKGGHMELQAIRYAAMISIMTFDKAVEIYSDFLDKTGSDLDARQTILDFLDWEEENEDQFAQDVRVVLASAEFSKELTTSVMWLNDRDLNIKCVRMKPYIDDGRLLIDVQQVIPLPEATSYQIQLREKERMERKDRSERHYLRKRFWTQLLNYAKAKTDLHANISPSETSSIGAGSGTSGLTYYYAIKKHSCGVELYIDRGKGSTDQNKAAFDQLYQSKGIIERDFGHPLSWQRLDNKQACRIHYAMDGGYRDDESTWQTTIEQLVEFMINFEKAMQEHVRVIN